MKAKGKRKKRLWLTVPLLLIIAIAVYILLRPGRDVQTAASYSEYQTARGTITNSLNFSGNINLIDSATYSAESAASVRNVYTEERAKVTEGQKLLRLSNGQTVEAGFDGTVNRLFVKKDADVNTGEALVQIADFDHMKVAVKVDEYDIDYVSIGQPCVITATANEATFESTISSIDYIPAASNDTVAHYTVEAEISGAAGKALPGMQVTLTIPRDEAEDVIILKEEALWFDDENQAYVLIKGENGELVQVYVEVGVTNGSFVEIKSGLGEGDTVYAARKSNYPYMFSQMARMRQSGGGGAQ